MSREPYCDCPIGQCLGRQRDRCVFRLAEIQANQARADALEEAAEIVDRIGSHPDVDDGVDAVNDTLGIASAAIRSAKDKP